MAMVHYVYILALLSNHAVPIVHPAQGGDGKLHIVDNLTAVPREWVAALPDSIEPKCAQALKGQCTLQCGVDFDAEYFEEADCKNMLLVPIVTHQGTYVITVAGHPHLS